MLKVLQVTTFFTEHGGVEKSVSDLSHALAQTHSVNVLCTTKGRTVRRAAGRVQVTAAGGALAISGRPLSLSFVHELARDEFDVAHFHLPCPMALLAAPFVEPRARIKVATWHHDLVRHKAFNSVTAPLMHRLLSSMDRIIVTAPPLLEHTPMLRRFRDKCEVIPLGIDEQRFNFIDHNAVLSIVAQYKRPVILYVGRLVYYKGCEVLVRAMKQVNDADLVMVGSGPLHHDLVRLVQEQGLQGRVHLLGRQPDEVLRNLFHACDVFVLPSVLPTECFGLVQVEAMLCGKPVVNTDLPTGVPWVSQHDQTGKTVATQDADALAAAINTLIDQPALARELGENARRRANSLFTLKKQVASTVELYERLLSRHSDAKAMIRTR